MHVSAAFLPFGQNAQPGLYFLYKFLVANGTAPGPLVIPDGSVPQKFSGPTPVVLPDLFVIVSVPTNHKV